MAKNANEVAIKSRKTKLTKKSVEELINIILRKDATEKNLNSQIVNLKNEVNSLESRISNMTKDNEGTDKVIGDLKDKISTNLEKYNNLQVEIAQHKRALDICRENYCSKIKEVEAYKLEIKAYKKVIGILTLGIIILGILLFI